MPDKVVLAYSGGLDTSVAIKWLKDKYNFEVIAVTIDVGNEKDFSSIKKKALDVGAVKSLVIDGKELFVKYFIFPALQANALYEGQYPLATALSRPLMAKLLVDTAVAEGAVAIAHGCTGKGNDQVRFEVSINALAPDMKILAPAREWGMTREETIAYAKKHGIPVPITVSSPYSIDECLWGRSIECGVLEDPWAEPPADVYKWTAPPDEAPDEPQYLEIGFDKGIPVGIDGEEMDGIALIKKLNEIKDTNKRVRQREFSNKFIDLPVEFLIKHHFTPNKISYIGFIFSLTASLLIAIYGLYFSIFLSWIIPSIMGIAGVMDLFDGEVARRTDRETQAGAFLDSNLDRLSDAIFVLALIYAGLLNYLLGYILLFLVIMISYIRSRAENEGVIMKGIGIMERAERILFLLFTIIIELIFYFLTFLLFDKPLTISISFVTRIPVTPVFLIGILIYTFALIYTILQRITYTFKTLKDLNTNKEK